MGKSKLNAEMDRLKALDEAGIVLGSRFKSRAVSKFFKNRLAVAGLIILAVIIFCCIAAPLITSHNPAKIDMRISLSAPTLNNILGTDKIGRDVFARILYGGRVSIVVGLGSALGAAFIGVALGCLAGYKGGWFDAVILRISEIFQSFPQLILVLLLVSITGQSLKNLILIFVFTGWGSIYRMTRAKVLSIREEEYVQALKAFGLGTFTICYKHILPNAVGPVAVNITLSTAMFILQEASLSFLGLGVPMETPTWGNILNTANDFRILKNNWWIWLPVGSLISLFVISINFIGDGLRDAVDSSS